jgi:retron-type reverse transcriptase
MDNLFLKIISLENLFWSWKEFRKGKRHKIDVQEFERNLEDNLFGLHLELKSKTYRHSDYTSFYITDPKSRHIHKACVKDRIVHHAIYRVLYPIFDPGFVDGSYSCRNKKGTHKAVKRLEEFTRIVSKNYTKPCWVLKCDVKKFFASVNHRALFDIVARKVPDPDTQWLLKVIIGSFNKPYVQQGLFERERERERDESNPRVKPQRNWASDWQFNFTAFCQYLSQRT